MKKRLFFYLITLISTSLFLALQLFDPVIIREQIESKTYDLRVRLRNIVRPMPPQKDIVIISIDEKSIREIGRWPWKRDDMAMLINKVAQGGPRVIGIDIMFSEAENEETDDKLSKAIKDAGNVVLATAFIVPEHSKDSAAPKDIPDFLWDSAFMEVKAVNGIQWKKWAAKPESVIPPIEKLAKVASLGHVYTHPDLDGVLRWELMYLNYGDDCYPSLSLQISRIALGIEMKDMVLYGGSGVKLSDKVISTDINGRVLVNYRPPNNSFGYTAASDVIKGRIDNAVFKGKIVLLGTSALATYDQKVTPVSANQPGVEKNANVVENILANSFLRKSPGVVELAVILLTGVLLGLLLPRLKAVPGVILAVCYIALYVLLSVYLLIYNNLWINLTYPFLNMSVIFIAQTVTRFFFEEKKAREIKKMFSSYVSPKIVEELINHPEKAMLGGYRKPVTILFSDIIGFTSLSEKLSPEDVVSMLNEYFKEMVDVIFRWDGTLDKFVGDEIMAFWGAPLDQPDHAELAVRCALDMMGKLAKIQQKWRREGKEILDCGIGINTGEALIGNIGAQGKKMDYTLIGDNVNLAARVEKLTREYGAKIIVTENTLKCIESLVEFDRFGHLEVIYHACVKVKGKEKEIKIFELKTKSAKPDLK